MSRAGLFAFLALAALLLSGAPASATLEHPKPASCAFGEDGTSASSFGPLGGTGKAIAFAQATRRLYATKSSHEPSYVFGFDASALCPGLGYPPLLGGFPLEVPELDVNYTSLAVDNSAQSSAGDIYLSDKSRIEGYDAAGKPLPGFPIPKPPESPGNPTGWQAIEVDPGGHLWAAAGTTGLVHEFSASGAELDRIDLSDLIPSPSWPNALAFDASGNLYVADRFGEGVWKLAAPAYNPDTAVEIDPRYAAALALDRSTGDLYVAHEKSIDRYDSAGDLIEQFPPVAPSGIEHFASVAVDEASQAVYAFLASGEKVQVFEALALPDLATAALSDLAQTSATLNATVDPSGLPLSACRFEWVSEEAFLQGGFENLASGGEAACEPPAASLQPNGGPQPVHAAATGFSPAGRYRFRITAEDANGSISSKSISFELAKPGAETVGSPLRTATTARLDSRLDPHGIATTYQFQYLTEAAYQANLEASRPPFEGALETSLASAGSGGEIELASRQVGELAPATAYRYRVIAENAGFGAATGEARTVETRASDAPLSHGRFPGPPGSDRAWEQVNLPDTSGNPVTGVAGVAADGEGAFYRVFGGTSASESGTFFDYLYAHRPAGEHPSEGWRTEQVFPSRQEATFAAWRPGGDDSLSTVLALNTSLEQGGVAAALWRLPTGGGSPAKLYESPAAAYIGPYLFSADASRALLVLKGAHIDPEHNSPAGVSQLYDVSSGTPHMLLLPGAVVPSCGAKGGVGLFDLPQETVARATHWVSADGSRAFFPSGCSGATHLYMDDLEANSGKGETVRVDGPPPSFAHGPSGPDCSAAMIRSTPEALYFWTQSRLAEEDTAVASCDSSPDDLTTGGDAYRYDLESHEYDCLTCVLPAGRQADVNPGGGPEGAARSIAIAPAGPRLYFTSRAHLLAGTPEAGTPAIYRVNTQTKELAYVGPLQAREQVGENPSAQFALDGSAITPDGRFLVFGSAAPGLDQLTGADNAHTTQDYLYDDLQRSLSCVSCPTDGSPPRAAVPQGISGAETAPNLTPLAANGDFAFVTPSALVNADQNTAPSGEEPSAGQDVYEWRDGRALLVSDGLKEWPSATVAPQVASVDASGRDLFFIEAAQLTPDALDGYQRLYDARIGGGIDFPAAPKPCPLEVCQGTPNGAPEEPLPGTGTFQGPGNEKPPASCPKGKVRKHGRCVKKPKRPKNRHHRAAKHHRRAPR